MELSIGAGLSASGAWNGLDSERFADPFCDVASLAFPQSIEQALRWCLVPGTPIEMADGSLKAIEAVKPGDVVLTKGGTHEKVLAAGVRQVDEEIVEVRFHGYSTASVCSLRLTGNHNVWRVAASAEHCDVSQLEKVPASEVRVGDHFYIPPNSQFASAGDVFRKVTQVRRLSYNGPVHNIEVENDHSYVAGGVVVANCEFIVLNNGVYRSALDRLFSYFITDVELDGVADDEKESWENYLDDDVDIKNVLHTVGLDAAVYGNSFSSWLPRFIRYLQCKKCWLEVPLREAHGSTQFRYEWSNFEFHLQCPRCHYRGPWRVQDRRDPSGSVLSFKRWNPHEMLLVWDPFFDECAYVWKVPEYYRRMIREGRLFHLERAPMEVIECVRDGSYLRLDDGVVHHMREDAIAGIYNRGWGISKVLSNFKQAWYVQVLRRYNEAIALDYVIPFRVITPEIGAPNGDNLGAISLSNHAQQLHGMLARRKRDPAAWNVLPFPVRYQALGGDARALAPRELIDQGQEDLLNGSGIFMDFFKGNMKMESAPVSLRLLEATHAKIPHNLNSFLRFSVKQIAMARKWKEPTARLARVTHADNLERRMAVLQLMSGKAIAMDTGLKLLNLDFREETRKQTDEQLFAAQESSKLQERMKEEQLGDQLTQPLQLQQQQQQGQQQGQGGQGQGQQQDPNAPQGPPDLSASVGPTDTPAEMWQAAQALAQQIAGMEPTQRQMQLRNLRKSQPQLAAFVRDAIEKIDQQARTAGKAIVLQQKKQGQ